ncbi:MAG: MFS transporter [Candidatus Solibacter usitatus]|nr:MFS transporter [Candidatus Solibacter usitatus]
MAGFTRLLRENRNYRLTWTGQVVSEVGDNFNNIAVFALVMEQTHSGLAVTAVMLARAVAMLMAGPVAGIVLDRVDRRKVMILSDLTRAVVALGFIFCTGKESVGLLLGLSALLMFASPFFTSGRASILPVLASKEELHTANSLTQTTQWTSVALGSFLGGAIAKGLGYDAAFVFNALSFLVSAGCIGLLRVPAGASFKAERRDIGEDRVARPWREYKDGLAYMGRTPLILGIALVGVGWATGGGAAQILFSLFGEVVFQRGAAGIGEVWGCAGLGLIAGGVAANVWGKKLPFERYKWAVAACYVVHGGAYVLFSTRRSYAAALVFIAISRAAVAVSSVLNFSQVLRHVPDSYRGRVFSTMESMVWGTMMVSMVAAGVASRTVDARTIGVVAGCLSSMTALGWGLAQSRGLLVEPPLEGVDPREIEVHGEPNA